MTEWDDFLQWHGTQTFMEQPGEMLAAWRAWLYRNPNSPAQYHIYNLEKRQWWAAGAELFTPTREKASIYGPEHVEYLDPKINVLVLITGKE